MCGEWQGQGLNPRTWGSMIPSLTEMLSLPKKSQPYRVPSLTWPGWWCHKPASPFSGSSVSWAARGRALQGNLPFSLPPEPGQGVPGTFQQGLSSGHFPVDEMEGGLGCKAWDPLPALLCDLGQPP